MSNTNAYAHEPPLWQPGPEAAEAVITRFQDFVATTRGIRISGYDDLWRWSVTELEDFWAAVWDFFELADVSGYDAVLASDAMPGAEWFPGARVNFATYLLEQGAPSDTAVITVDEFGVTTTWTRSELRRQVGAFAGTMQDVGVVEGDRVVGYLPNIGEAIVAFLATASLGALWSTVGQDYADSAVVDRFAQLEIFVHLRHSRGLGRRSSTGQMSAAYAESVDVVPLPQWVARAVRESPVSEGMAHAQRSSTAADGLGAAKPAAHRNTRSLDASSAHRPHGSPPVGSGPCAPSASLWG